MLPESLIMAVAEIVILSQTVRPRIILVKWAVLIKKKTDLWRRYWSFFACLASYHLSPGETQFRGFAWGCLLCDLGLVTECIPPAKDQILFRDPHGFWGPSSAASLMPVGKRTFLYLWGCWQTPCQVGGTVSRGTDHSIMGSIRSTLMWIKSPLRRLWIG